MKHLTLLSKIVDDATKEFIVMRPELTERQLQCVHTASMQLFCKWAITIEVNNKLKEVQEMLNRGYGVGATSE